MESEDIISRQFHKLLIVYFVTSLRIQVFSTSSYIEKNKETEDNFTGCQEEVKACDVAEHLRPHAWPSNCPPPSWDRTATHKQKREASPSTLPFHYKAEQQTKTTAELATAIARYINLVKSHCGHHH